MKTNHKIITFLLSISYILFSCADIKVIEKDIFLKKVDLYEYIEPQNTVITKTGFLTTYNKLVTNGDSLSCEIVKSNERYLSKIDFNGNIIWEKKIDQFNLIPSFFSEDEKGNFYNIQNSGFKIGSVAISDSTFKFQSIIPLNNGGFLTGGEQFKNIIYWRNGILLAYGQMQYSKVTNEEYVAKPFFCLIDKNGIIKFKLIEESTPNNSQMHFKINEEGEISGILTLFNNKAKAKIRAMKLDKNLEIIKNNETEILTNSNINPQINVKFSKNNTHIIVNDMANMKYMFVDENLNFETFDLGSTFAQNTNYINGNTDDIIISETAANNFSKITKLNKIGKSIEKEVILETIHNFNSSLFNLQNDKYTISRLINTNFNSRPNITFVKTKEKIEVANTLYISQYKKYNCYRGR